MIIKSAIINKPTNPKKTELQRLQAKVKREKWENQFLFLWKALNGPELIREYQFNPDRKWRFDFAHVKTKVAIEIEGGTWSGGRHTRGSGYSKDCEKYNKASKLGWCVLRYTSDAINVKSAREVFEAIEFRERMFR